jgi:deoxyribodipyrimidine photo-lyase
MPKHWPRRVTIDTLELEPMIAWTTGMSAAWTPGQEGAARELERFLEDGIHAYPSDRDRPDRVGTSRLSPHLHFGEISPRELRQAIDENAASTALPGLITASDCYARELGWREFAHHLLFHFPRTTDHPLRSEFASFAWADDEEQLLAWQRGQTGFPIVDAGMRQLWSTGWMHNRVRMIVASFLVKDLLLPWQAGARWFWDTLVDANLANNTLGWQWSAGCGADAAPFFRIFNPVLQGEKFDPDGNYVRAWVPELARVPLRWIHKPWMAPSAVLGEAGVALGDTYPQPIVDHGQARERALQAFEQIKRVKRL